jgi:hypothetical protein
MLPKNEGMQGDAKLVVDMTGLRELYKCCTVQ